MQNSSFPSENQPTVSWVLCTHVSNDYLQHAIRSCLCQSFADFELLVIVNGGDANEIAHDLSNSFGYDPRVKVFSTSIRYLTFSLNLGVHHARGNLIARMDGDDISTLDRLEKQVEFLNFHPEVMVLGTAYCIIDGEGHPQRTVHLPLGDDAIRKAMLFGNPICHPSVMMRREAIMIVGGYLGAGIHAEDYDLWSRLMLNPSAKFANLPDVCLEYRSVPVGVARRSRWGYASMAASQYRNWVLGEGCSWLFAAFISKIKALQRSKPLSK